MKPTFSLKVNDNNFKWNDRVESLRISDEAGFICDQMNMKLDDTDGALAIPRKGVTLKLSIGYEGELVEYGEYIVDDCAVEESRLTVKAKGFDTSSALKTIRSETYDVGFKDTVEALARRNDLEPYIYGELADYFQDRRFMQNNESDLNFLSRICRSYNAYFKVVGKRLCVLKKGSGKTVSGKDLGTITIRRDGVDKDWRYEAKYRDAYKCVKADYVDLETGAIREVSIGEGQPEKKLSRRFADEAAATNEVKSALESSDYEGSALTFTLGMGDPRIRSETKIDARGFKKGVDGIWIVEQVTHEITKRAYITQVKCAKPGR